MKRIRVEEINGIIYIDGIDIIKKVSELSKENDRLYLENKRQKEVIDKAIEIIKGFLCSKEYINVDGIAIANNYNDILDLLKEVSE